MRGRQKVYVITSEGGPTKIGISQHPTTRRRQLQHKFMERRLSVAHIANVDGLKAIAVERKVHELLRETHVHGEWFDIGLKEAIEAIDIAIQAVRAAGITEPAAPDIAHWHLRLTVDPEVKRRIWGLATSAGRSTTNYIGLLIEQHLKEKDAVQQ